MVLCRVKCLGTCIQARAWHSRRRTHLTMRPCTQAMTSYTSGTTRRRPRMARSNANAGPTSEESSALRSLKSQDSRKRSCAQQLEQSVGGREGTLQ